MLWEMKSVSRPSLAALVGALSLLPTAGATPVYFGTSGNPGEGIYLADFDASTGRLSAASLAAELPASGFLCLHPTQPVLYAVSGSEIRVFQRGENHALEAIQTVATGGQGACHLEVTPCGQGLAVANYGDGSMSLYRIDPANGKIQGEAVVKRFEGKGPNPDRQEGPHAHGTHFLGEMLLMPDLGTDKIMAFQFDPAAGLDAVPWSEWPQPFIPCQPGDGPRHAAFHPDGKHVFAIHELSNVLEAWELAKEGPKSIARLGTLPDDWKGPNTTAEVQIHPEGKWIFGSNRGHDSILVAAFDPAKGSLTRHEIVPCGLKTPRHFTLSPCAKWLLAAGQQSHEVAVFSFDAATGQLVRTDFCIEVPAPTCILFAPES